MTDVLQTAQETGKQVIDRGNVDGQHQYHPPYCETTNSEVKLKAIEMSNNKGLGEQALSKVAEAGFSSQLDAVEKLDVDIQTNPLDAMQGKVDSVSVQGKKVVQGDLRVEEMEMHIDSIKIDAMSAAFGNIKLEKPTDATARIVLTEQDVNRALNSELMHNELQNLSIQVEGKPTTVDVQQAEFSLPGNGKIGVNAKVFVQETGETDAVAFTAVPHLDRSRGTISLEDVQYSEGKDLSPEVTKTLRDKIRDLLELRDFALEGMSLRLTQLEVQQGRMTLQAQSHVESLPSS